MVKYVLHPQNKCWNKTYSALIRNKEITKAEALNLLKKNVHSVEQIRREKKYIANKFNLSTEEFDKLLSSENIKSHYDYKNSEFLFQICKKLFSFVR
jgi:hypothetical protein